MGFIQRAKRALSVFSVLFTAFSLVAMFTPLANILARPLIVEPVLRKADMLVVLGGGAYKNGVLARGSNERLVHGLLLYKKGFAGAIVFSGGSVTNTAKKVFYTITATGHTAVMDVIEADIMRDAAAGLGIPKEAIHVDAVSTNTYTNLVEAGDYMKGKGFKSCLLITSPTHMYRAFGISRKLGLDCYPAPVKDYTQLRTGAIDRVVLLKEVIWEYCALALYKAYGYI
ncbi:MAG: YdcF family protein [Deltaproteobacteria bacterium]|nr:YdcF family protein [Deltaproteobacteria bacterium]